MAEKKISEQAAVTPLDPSMKRSIQMKMFFTDADKQRVALAKAEGKPPAECEKAGGQIIGRIFEVNERVGEINGEVTRQLYATGEFEAVTYDTGEVMESTVAYLPGYYLEGVRGALARNDGAAVLIGAEVMVVATGKAIPYAYEVRNIVPREADSPLNRLKALIASKGKLRLPPPVELKPIDHPEPEAPAEEPATA